MELVFIVALFLIAYLYASVGHGGASGYLALMAFYGLAPEMMKSSALILNLFVSLVAFISFVKGGFFRWRLLIPFVIVSIPLAFLGAAISISPALYKKILGVCLIIATTRMLFSPKDKEIPNRPLNIPVAMFSGGVIGLFSGMIGIGGGIILSPLLIISRWATIKESACVSSAFIFLNSASGLMSMWHKGSICTGNQLFVWILVALAGGLLGSYLGSFKIPSKWLKYLLCLVLIVTSFKLFVL